MHQYSMCDDSTVHYLTMALIRQCFLDVPAQFTPKQVRDGTIIRSNARVIRSRKHARARARPSVHSYVRGFTASYREESDDLIKI
jgi:hypothetical protein